VAGKATGKATFPNQIDPKVLELGGEGSWSNTPTVTYQPLLGVRQRCMLSLSAVNPSLQAIDRSVTAGT